MGYKDGREGEGWVHDASTEELGKNRICGEEEEAERKERPRNSQWE